MGGKGLFWSRLPWNREVQPHPALCPGRALLQPKQGRCSNLLRVGCSCRSRVSLIRLPSLIIPREVVGAVSAAALRAPRVPRCTALSRARVSVPKPLVPSLQAPTSAAVWRRRAFGVARAWEGVQTPSKGRQKVASLQGVNI